MDNKVKGVWIRREGCMWDAEVCEMTFKEFAEKLSAFADEEGGFATPYIITRFVNGKSVDIWYDENGLSYMPAPSGMGRDYPEPLVGMLFIADADYETGESISLTEEMIQAVLKDYYAPTMEELHPFAKECGPLFAIQMAGYKLLHYNVWAKEEKE